MRILLVLLLLVLMNSSTAKFDQMAARFAPTPLKVTADELTRRAQ